MWRDVELPDGPAGSHSRSPARAVRGPPASRYDRDLSKRLLVTGSIRSLTRHVLEKQIVPGTPKQTMPASDLGDLVASKLRTSSEIRFFDSTKTKTGFLQLLGAVEDEVRTHYTRTCASQRLGNVMEAHMSYDGIDRETSWPSHGSISLLPGGLGEVFPFQKTHPWPSIGCFWPKPDCRLPHRLKAPHALLNTLVKYNIVGISLF